MPKKKNKSTYGLSTQSASKKIPAPNLPYRPQNPKHYSPNIALIGCGGIREQHLKAYKKAKYKIVALCDADLTKATQRQKQFFPRAKIYTDYPDVLNRNDIEV